MLTPTHSPQKRKWNKLSKSKTNPPKTNPKKKRKRTSYDQNKLNSFIKKKLSFFDTIAQDNQTLRDHKGNHTTLHIQSKPIIIKKPPQQTPKQEIEQYWDQLSDEILLRIFKGCQCIELLQCQGVCKVWARVSVDNSIWRPLFFRTLFLRGFDYPPQVFDGFRWKDYYVTCSYRLKRWGSPLLKDVKKRSLKRRLSDSTNEIELDVFKKRVRRKISFSKL